LLSIASIILPFDIRSTYLEINSDWIESIMISVESYLHMAFNGTHILLGKRVELVKRLLRVFVSSDSIPDWNPNCLFRFSIFARIMLL